MRGGGVTPSPTPSITPFDPSQLDFETAPEGYQDIFLVLLGSYTVDTNTVNNPIFYIEKIVGDPKFALGPYTSWDNKWLEYENGTDKKGTFFEDGTGGSITEMVINKYPELFYATERAQAEQIGEITEEMVRGVTV